MNINISIRKKAIFVGILIIVAYSMLFGGVADAKWLTTLVDVISGLAVIGIAALMFPLFKISNKALSLGYLLLKILEGALMIASGLVFLSGSIEGWRSWIYNYPQTYVFIASASLFYVLLFKTNLVPRFISVWGLVACCTLLIVNLAKLFGVSYQALDILMILIVTNEVFLAIWLIVKGFKTTLVASASAETNKN